jgi:hypothetical protein
MIEGVILLLITIHWGYALGMFLAMRTNLSVYQLLLICILIKYGFMFYGDK